MTALSINLPHQIAEQSQVAAKQLGITRTEFIRQAVIHELQNYYAELERQAMASSFAKMNKNKRYKVEAETLDRGFDQNNLKDEEENWWKKK